MAEQPITKFDRMLALFGLVRQRPAQGTDVNSAFSWIEYLRTGLDPFSGYAQISQDRIIKYNEYDMMDQYGDIAVACDIYGEEASQPDPEEEKVIWVESKNKRLEAAANEMLRSIRAEDKVWAVARNLAKYGDVFEYLLTNQEGIYNLQFVHPSRVNRVQTDKLLGFQCDDLARLIQATIPGAAPGGTQGQFFQPWDFIHFRIEADDRETIYGRSFLESSRKCWKELQILETMAAVFRIVKSVERNVIFVDVGDASPQEAKKWVERWRRHFRKDEFIDPVTGDFRIDLRGISPMEDIIIPVRSGSTTRVEKLAASPDIGAVEDLEYFRSKLRTALGIPKEYFDQQNDNPGWNAKEALILKDARFSRKIARIQRALIAGFTRMTAIHLTMIDETWKPEEFEIRMAPVNQISERLAEERWLRIIELLNGALPLAQIAQLDQKLWNQIFLQKIMEMPPEIIEALTRVTSPLPGVTVAMAQAGIAGSPPGGGSGQTGTPVGGGAGGGASGSGMMGGFEEAVKDTQILTEAFKVMKASKKGKKESSLHKSIWEEIESYSKLIEERKDEENYQYMPHRKTDKIEVDKFRGVQYSEDEIKTHKDLLRDKKDRNTRKGNNK